MQEIRATEYIELYHQGEFAQAKRHTSQNPCPLCKGLGFHAFRDAKGYEKASACRCEGIDQKIKCFNQAHIPVRYLNARFEDFRPMALSAQEALIKTENFAWSFTMGSKGLLFFGGYGTGKTYLSICALKVLTLQRGIPAKFIEFAHLLSELKAQFQTDQSEQHMDKYVQIPCLVIDELGGTHLSDWGTRVLDELITKRYNASQTTIFTTNFDPRSKNKHLPNHLSEKIGARLYSRLQQMCDTVALFGPDYRNQSEELKG
jgi:DNA replication protein DnaC